MRKEGEEAEQNLKDRLQRMELHRIELEEEVSRLKGTLASERLHAEEQLMLTKQRIKQEEVGHNLPQENRDYIQYDVEIKFKIISNKEYF